jgi:divalent metal cation (Fe/Co/Zn/Cd) transporter
MNADRRSTLRRALRLEYLTVLWNVVEGVVAVWAALSAASVALLAFGIDSFIETSSGLILIWRLGSEIRNGAAHEHERTERRAQKLVGVSLFVLAVYVAYDALAALLTRERPEPTLVGIALTALSLPVMVWLARAKRRLARTLGSHALEADAFQTTACWWLSIAALGGIGLNATLGFWWADPVAALVMSPLIAREGREAWRGVECGCG